MKKETDHVYLIKWRADYITNYTDEAVSCWTIEHVQWAYEQSEETLKSIFNNQCHHKD